MTLRPVYSYSTAVNELGAPLCHFLFRTVGMKSEELGRVRDEEFAQLTVELHNRHAEAVDWLDRQTPGDTEPVETPERFGQLPDEIAGQAPLTEGGVA